MPAPAPSPALVPCPSCGGSGDPAVYDDDACVYCCGTGLVTPADAAAYEDIPFACAFTC